MPVLMQGRPAQPRYRPSDAPQTQPSLILNRNGVRYLCWLYGNEQDNRWKICRIQTSLNNEPVGDGYNPIEDDSNLATYADGDVVLFTYPYGSGAYDFHPAHIDQYEFTFLL